MAVQLQTPVLSTQKIKHKSEKRELLYGNIFLKFIFTYFDRAYNWELKRKHTYIIILENTRLFTVCGTSTEIINTLQQLLPTHDRLVDSRVVELSLSTHIVSRCVPDFILLTGGQRGVIIPRITKHKKPHNYCG